MSSADTFVLDSYIAAGVAAYSDSIAEVVEDGAAVSSGVFYREGRGPAPARATWHDYRFVTVFHAARYYDLEAINSIGA